MSDIVERLENMWMEQEPKLLWTDMEAITEEAADEITFLRTENEALRRDVKTAVMGDSAELQDVKRENEKLREALKSERERCAKIAERYLSNHEPVRLTASSIAAAIRESGE